jgi:hypothetical protein
MVTQGERRPLFSIPELDLADPPEGSDRRSFMMRSALAAAVGALTGRPIAAFAQTPAKPPRLSVNMDKNLNEWLGLSLVGPTSNFTFADDRAQCGRYGDRHTFVSF